jgi:hypothetical protein
MHLLLYIPIPLGSQALRIAFSKQLAIRRNQDPLQVSERAIVIFAPFPLNLPRANRLPRSVAAEAALSVDRFAGCVYRGWAE